MVEVNAKTMKVFKELIEPDLQRRIGVVHSDGIGTAERVEDVHYHIVIGVIRP